MSVSRRTFLKTTAVTGIGIATLPTSSFAAQGNGVMPAPMMPAPSFVETNGIDMAVYEQGEGPAVVFCHGWPAGCEGHRQGGVLWP